MAADFGFIAHAAQAVADEFTPGRLGDAAAKRGLANAGRADEAQDRPLQLVGARLHGQILDDPVLHLFQAEMIGIQHGLRRDDVLLHLAALAPRQAQQRIEIVANHRGFGRLRRHRLQLLQFAQRLFTGFLGEFDLLDLLFQLGDLVLFLIGIAQLALDRLHLFVEIIFALGLLHLPLHAVTDLLFHLQHAHLAFHEGEDLFQPQAHIRLGQQRLLVRNLQAQVGGNGVGKAPRFLHRRNLAGDFRGDLAVQLDKLFELALRRTQQGGDLGFVALHVRPVFNFGHQIGATGIQLDQRRAALAFHKHLHRAVGQFQQLQHIGERADVIQFISTGIFIAGVLLAEQEHGAAVVHGRFERGHRFFAAHEQRHDHLREHHDIAQRQHGQGLVGHVISVVGP